MPIELQSLAFDPADAQSRAGSAAAAPAVFALYGAEAKDEPYIGRTPNLRGRLERLLQPSPKHPRRLQLAGRVRRIAWRLTGSDFESLLAAVFSSGRDLRREGSGAHAPAGSRLRPLSGQQPLSAYHSHQPAQPARSRLGLRAICFARGGRALRRRGAEAVPAAPLHRRSGPRSQPSGLRLLRNEDVPGAVLSRAAPTSATAKKPRQCKSFLATRGESRLVVLRSQRDEASARMEFESRRGASCPGAARGSRPCAGAGTGAAPESVARGDSAARRPTRTKSPSSFLKTAGCAARPPSPRSACASRTSSPAPPRSSPSPWRTRADSGRARGSGIKEQGSEIRDQNLPKSPGRALNKSPEAAPIRQLPRRSSPPGACSKPAWTQTLRLAAESESETLFRTIRQGHLALLKRWYYRPEVRRPGEIFFPDAEGDWPVKAILRGVGRVAAKMLTTPHRE